MRTSADLILELNAEAEHFTTVAIAVGFERHTRFVFSGDESAATKLNELMREGGEPIGLVGIVQ